MQKLFWQGLISEYIFRNVNFVYLKNAQFAKTEYRLEIIAGFLHLHLYLIQGSLPSQLSAALLKFLLSRLEMDGIYNNLISDFLSF